MRYINPESAKKAFTELKASPYFVDKSGFNYELMLMIQDLLSGEDAE